MRHLDKGRRNRFEESTNLQHRFREKKEKVKGYILSRMRTKPTLVR